jgi:putative aldouronate transport system permease protein
MQAKQTRTTSYFRMVDRLREILIHLVMVLVALIMVLPFVLIASASLTDNTALVQHGYRLIPSQISLSAYQYLFRTPAVIGKAYSITIFVASLGTSAGLLIMAMLAYAVSRMTGREKKIVSFFVLFTILFGGGLVPFYLVMTQIYHLKNSLLALILPYLVNSFNVLLLRSYFSQLPKEILDSAKVDGANEVQVFFKIVMPLSTPALATIGLFTFLSYWNDYFLSLLFITKNELYPLQYLLFLTLGNVGVILPAAISTGIKLPRESLRMAMAVIAAGPAIFVSLSLGRYFVRGITLGGINK